MHELVPINTYVLLRNHGELLTEIMMFFPVSPKLSVYEEKFAAHKLLDFFIIIAHFKVCSLKAKLQFHVKFSACGTVYFLMAVKAYICEALVSTAQPALAMTVYYVVLLQASGLSAVYTFSHSITLLL